MLSELLANRGCNLLELLGGELKVGVGEAHVLFALHGYKVNVCMWDFEAQDALADLDAWDGFPDGNSDFLGKYLQSGDFLVGEVEDVVNLALGYHECVAFLQGTDVEEGVVVFVLGNLVAGNLACYYFTENCHCGIVW